MGDGVSSRRLLVEFREYFSPAFVASGVELQVPRLRYPGFPVEVGGVGELHAACFNGKPHTRTVGEERGQEIRVRLSPTVRSTARGMTKVEGGVLLN